MATGKGPNSWRVLLLDVKRRGLAIAPKLAVVSGALGVWKAVTEVFATTQEQRCWVHKTANVPAQTQTSQSQGDASRDRDGGYG